jgi:hypothetical protein
MRHVASGLHELSCKTLEDLHQQSPNFCPFAGRHSVDADAVAAPVGKAAVAAATTGQQQSVAGPAESRQRPRRAAAAGVAAVVFAAQDNDAPAGAVHKRNGNSNKAGTLPEEYTAAGLAGREKCLWDAKRVRLLALHRALSLLNVFGPHFHVTAASLRRMLWGNFAASTEWSQCC